MRIFWMILTAWLLCSCNTNTNNNNANDSVIYSTSKIPEKRSAINPNPVKTYSETVKSFATTDQFSVELFETKETFDYLIKVSYKNLEAKDTLHVPNFGEVPAVEIKEGAKSPSCIVGFLDSAKQFRESKLIYFEDDKIKIHVIQHYGVFVK